MKNRPLPRLLVGTLTAAVLALLASCGGADNDQARAQAATTAAPAQSGERARALAATTRLAVALPNPADPLLSNLTIPADAATRGMWGAVQNWPMNAIHAALLPDGKVLS